MWWFANKFVLCIKSKNLMNVMAMYKIVWIVFKYRDAVGDISKPFYLENCMMIIINSIVSIIE